MNISYLIDEAYDIGMVQVPSEIEKLANLFYELNPKNILEIGSFQGGTFYLWCKLSKNDAKKISVDIRQNGCDYDLRNKNMIGWGNNVHIIENDSHLPETLEKVKQILNGEELDFLFIDGDHSYEGVKKDYELYKELVKHNGIIAFHDINDTNFHISSKCFVSKFWKELEKEEKIEFSVGAESCGIGIIKVKKINNTSNYFPRNLNIELSFNETDNKINFYYKESNPLYTTICVRDLDSEIPIYFTKDVCFDKGYGFFIVPISNYSFQNDKYCNGFKIDFFDKSGQLIDSKTLRIKNNTNQNVVKFPTLTPFDCLYVNYREHFYDSQYDKVNFIDDNLDLVIDVGANVGFFSYYILNKGAKKVISLEPNNKAFESLSSILGKNQNVTLLKKGLDVKSGQRDLFFTDGNTTISSFSEISNFNKTTIDTINFEDLLSTFNVDKISLLKMDIEGAEYDIFDNLTDEQLFKIDKLILEFHDKPNYGITKILNKLKQLNFSFEIRSQTGFEIVNPETNPTRGTLLAKQVKKNLPDECFVTFTTKNYLLITEFLVKSLLEFSDRKIVVYSVNCDVPYYYDNLITKRIDVPDIEIPDFLGAEGLYLQSGKVEMPRDNLGCVSRNDIRTYKLLTLKPTIILDSINNGVQNGIFLDSDGVVRENIDSLFDEFKKCTSYPLIGKCIFEFMLLNGTGSVPDGQPALEEPLMKKFGVSKRTTPYLSTNVILFTDKMTEFMQEWSLLSKDKDILSNNVLYAPYHDETIVNVLLWKHKCTNYLPISHFNTIDLKCTENFYKETGTNIQLDTEWQYIPENKSTIKLLHGCKSTTELEKILQFLKEKNKIIIEDKRANYCFAHNNRRSSIAIVTLFDDNYYDLAKYSIKNKKQYTAKHGYDLIYYDDTLDKTRPPQWSKVLAVENHLQNYNWIWWIDIDALIMNFDIKLESIIDHNYDMIFTQNKYSYISNGSSFFRNCDLTKKFLKNAYSYQNINVQKFDHEQQSMRALLLEKDSIYALSTKLIDERICNSFWFTDFDDVLKNYPTWNQESNIYKEGDFVIQFSGQKREKRLSLMSEFFAKVK